MKKRKYVYAFVVVILIVFAIYLFFSRKETIHSEDLSLAGIHYGSPDAEITIVEFGDLRCVDCRIMHEQIRDILSEKIKNNQVQYVFKEVYEDMYYALPVDIDDDYSKMDVAFSNVDFYLSKENNQEISDQILTKRKKNSEIIKQEMKDCNMKYIPTIFIGDTKIVETCSTEDFERILETYLR